MSLFSLVLTAVFHFESKIKINCRVVQSILQRSGNRTSRRLQHLSNADQVVNSYVARIWGPLWTINFLDNNENDSIHKSQMIGQSKISGGNVAVLFTPCKKK